MSKEAKNTNDEEKNVPNPEGYTIVKYLQFVAVFSFFIGMMLSIPFCNDIHDYVVMFGGGLLFWLIARKFTEVKVNLRITEKGLEQIKLSGSRCCPEHRLIEWKDMSGYCLDGRSRGIDFLVFVKNDKPLRISMPGFLVFERQKNNWDSFTAFKNEFLIIAPKNGVHRALFG